MKRRRTYLPPPDSNRSLAGAIGELAGALIVLTLGFVILAACVVAIGLTLHWLADVVFGALS